MVVLLGSAFRWLCGLLCIAVILLLVLGSGLFGFRLFQLEWKPQGETNLTMREASVPFSNDLDITQTTGSLPFMAGVVINVDGEGIDYKSRDEVFLGGGRTQADVLLRYDDTAAAFVDISSAHNLSKNANDATMGGTSFDVDNDGDSDLLVARESGVWLYLNDEGRLGGGQLLFQINEASTAISIAPGDVNNDGLVDLYVSGYIKNERVEGQTIFNRPYGGYSHLYINQGGLNWRDASEEYGVWRQHNTFTALFVDLDNDLDSDLVIAQDTGVVEMYENKGTPPFEPILNPSVKSYPMGIAAGSFNNNQFTDLYFSNVGHTLPKKLLRGDIPAGENFNPLYMQFENMQNLNFLDVASERRTARLGFGWGVVAADLNLDGWEDLIVAQNYAKFGQPAIIHRYNGKIMQNYAGKEFKPVEKKAGAINPHFAISPLVGDFNGDNLPDLFWANLKGNSKAYLNETPNANVIAIDLGDNLEAHNARISVKIGNQKVHRQITAGQGLSSDQSAKLIIGLGNASQADQIEIKYRDGSTRLLEDIPAGARVLATGLNEGG